MALPRCFSKLLSSSSSPKAISAIRSFSTETITQPLSVKHSSSNHQTSVNCLKPTTIPYQSKVANSVHFVGSIEHPVQLSSLPDGVLCAFTVLQQNKRKNLARLRIPVVFHGDLAHTAVLHLKEKDLVYVTGQLSTEALLHTTQDKLEHIKDFRNSLQVLASGINFVQKFSEKTQSKRAVDQDEEGLVSSAKNDENTLDRQLWNDFFAHPDDWWDNRSSKGNLKHSFNHKKSGQLLWIDDSTPDSVLSNLDELSSAKTPLTPTVGVYKSNNSDSLWADLIDNPDQWSDYRGAKLKWVNPNPKYPDFKQKSTGTCLWLSSAPDWALSKVKSITDSRNTGNGVKATSVAVADPKCIKEEDLWTDLVLNPNKWWDNRASKRKPTYPDFKHKDSSQALWIGKKTPQWVLDKLPPVATIIGETK